MALLSKSDKTPQKATALAVASESYEVKHPKPKILLLDLDKKSEDAIRKLGLKVSSGSLGRPYKVPKSNNFEPVVVKASFPNHKEQEIVVVDLWYEKSDDGPQAEKHKPNGSNDLWADCTTGRIDPRPRAMFIVKDDFDRILSNGGVFIIFAEDMDTREMHVGSAPFRELRIEETIKVNNWSFLSALDELHSTDDHGEEMSCTLKGGKGGALPDLLMKHLNGGNFSCTFEPYSYAENDWVILATNKFGAGVAATRKKEDEGIVLLLPQIANKPKFLEDLFTEILPVLCPMLFPHIERGLWTHMPEYELESIIALEEEKKEVELQALKAIATIDKDIENERKLNGWIHDLLTATGDDLVEAVKKALSLFGFTDVIDVDKERDRDGKSRREDLQIRDDSPLLIVDIKGVGGCPKDEDVLQADKHAAIRMRELSRTDVFGLSIVNHQRYLPPLDRDNSMPFRQELIHAAEERSLGLLTTWDIYRIAKNFTRHGWMPADVKPIFYRKGRIEIVPNNYEFLGKIAKAWTDKFGVVIENGSVEVGDVVSVEFPIMFEEIKVDSLQVDSLNVSSAAIGDRLGLLWSPALPKLTEGMRVFRVSMKPS